VVNAPLLPLPASSRVTLYSFIPALPLQLMGVQEELLEWKSKKSQVCVFR
jgi:hypothetical protein